jgi:hypothetical protein
MSEKYSFKNNLIYDLRPDSYRDMIYELRITIYVPIAIGIRSTIYDLRPDSYRDMINEVRITIYDLRFTKYEVRFAICNL